MKHKYLILSFIFTVSASISSLIAQDGHKHGADITYKSKIGPDGRVRCFTMEADSIRRSLNPSLPTLQQEENWLQEEIRKYKELENAKVSQGKPKATVLTLPMVFHVITSGGTDATNIAATWVQRQVDQLNIDYRNLAGSTNTAAGDCQLQFCLALRDPSDNTLAEPGIHRVTTYGNGSQTQTTMDNTIKPATIWDPSQYINIWVVNLGQGLLGYAQFPSNSTLQGLNTSGGSANTDGVVILYTSLGSVANPNPAGGVYGKGRTLTHELGHWLGLRHIWGDGNCSATDYCADTPPAGAANYGCPNGTNSCTTDAFPDMIQNYMDYTDDGCMNIFTNDQVTRVRTVMNVATNRASLANSTKCNSLTPYDAAVNAIVAPTGTICGTSFTPQVTIKNNGNTTMTSCVITYNLDGGTNQTFNWTGSLAPGATANVSLSPMTSTVGAHVFNVSTSLPNGNADGNTNNDSGSSNVTLSVVTGVTLPLTEGFTATAFPPANWTLNNGGNTVTWARATVGTAPTTGNSAVMDNFSSTTDLTGDIDDLKTPALDLSSYATATLTFDVAYARYSATYSDTLQVVVSTDCGQTWTTAYSKGGSTLATQADQTSAYNTPTTWRNETVNLGQFVGNNAVYVAFRNRSGYGQKLYLDNINITGASPTTPPTASFTSTPTTSACTGQTIQYTSTSTGTPTSYSWTFQGGTPATSTAQNPTVTYATAGTYNVSLTASNTLGSNTANQTSYITVNSTPTLSGTTPGNRCGAGTVTLGAAASTGTINWYTTSTGGTSVGTGTSWTTPTIGTTTTYYAEVTSGGCTSARTAVVASINPVPTVTNPGNKTVCLGASLPTVTFTGSSTSSTYSWTNNNTGTGLAASGTGNITTFTPTALGNSIVTVTPTLNGCTGQPTSFSITVNDCTNGIEANVDDLLVIYPNPTGGMLTVKGESLAKYNKMELIDATGRIVGSWSINGNPMNLDLTSYASGSYNLKISGMNTQTLKKIEIKK